MVFLILLFFKISRLLVQIYPTTLPFYWTRIEQDIIISVHVFTFPIQCDHLSTLIAHFVTSKNEAFQGESNTIYWVRINGDVTQFLPPYWLLDFAHPLLSLLSESILIESCYPYKDSSCYDPHTPSLNPDLIHNCCWRAAHSPASSAYIP
jgi:hypothetical protein